MAGDRVSRIEKSLLLIWIVANLIVGTLTVHDFGISFDEPRYYHYAEQSVDAYRSFFSLFYEPEYGPTNLRYYGPSFIILVELVARILRWFFTTVPEIEIWHFSYFVLFQLTGLALYSLMKRWFSRWTAWAVLILFTTQPLLWGHAFINPKDIPFMAFMVISVFAGFNVLDAFDGQMPELSLKNSMLSISAVWNQVAASDRRRYRNLLSMGSCILVLFSLANYVISPIVAFFYLADPGTLPGRIFHAYAQSLDVPLESYVSRVQTLFHRSADPILALTLISLVTYLGYLLLKTQRIRIFFNALFQNLKDLFVPSSRTGRAFTRTSTLYFWRQIFQALRSGSVIFAGLILGLTISIRVLGPLAGLIVVVCWFAKARSKAFPVLIAYLLWAGFFAYLSWPYLWLSPINRYLESLTIMSNFPWPGKVLFNGHYYIPNKLPPEYLPVLFNIQLTEPVLVCFYSGIIVMIWTLLRKGVQTDLLVYVGLGFIFPVTVLVSLKIELYDNFRQALFVLPGAFVIAGYALEAFLSRFRPGWMRVILILLIAVPGIYSGVKLHPYEYIYYNSLVGGTRGAARRYELDYWRISYRELALQVNQKASLGARIFVSGVPFTFEPYARPDLKIEHKINDKVPYNFEYAALTSRWDTDERLFPNADDVLSVERDGAILSVLKYAKGQTVR